MPDPRPISKILEDLINWGLEHHDYSPVPGLTRNTLIDELYDLPARVEELENLLLLLRDFTFPRCHCVASHNYKCLHCRVVSILAIKTTEKVK